MGTCITNAMLDPRPEPQPMRFAPKLDITAYEIALLVDVILAALGQTTIQSDAIPVDVRRHFEPGQHSFVLGQEPLDIP